MQNNQKKNTLNESAVEKLRKVVRQILKEEVSKGKLINETDGYDNDNGDDEHEEGNSVMNAIFGIEKHVGTFNFVDALAAIIDYSHKTNIGSERLAGIVSNYLKNKRI